MPTHQIHFHHYPNPTDLPAADQDLLAAARAALGHSYSPYSNFQVAAAARLANGAVVEGWNTENAAYPMCLCAEPATLAAAASLYPEFPVEAMAITVRNPHKAVTAPATPCGSCRQQLAEYEHRFGQPVRLILSGETGPVLVFERAGDLLPLGFTGEWLGGSGNSGR